MQEPTPEQLDRVASILAEKLFNEKRALWIEPEAHHSQHKWIESKMLSEEQMRQLRMKIIESAVIWAVPIIAGFVLMVFWDGFMQFLKKVLA